MPIQAEYCPSAVEYVRPVFARIHEGACRYVVQIPREGYLTQPVEVTKRLQPSCTLIQQGFCRTSPRWQSFLVDEMFHPDAAFPFDWKIPQERPNTAAAVVWMGKASHVADRFTVEKSIRDKLTEADVRGLKPCTAWMNFYVYSIVLALSNKNRIPALRNSAFEPFASNL